MKKKSSIPKFVLTERCHETSILPVFQDFKEQGIIVQACHTDQGHFLQTTYTAQGMSDRYVSLCFPHVESVFSVWFLFSFSQRKRKSVKIP